MRYLAFGELGGVPNVVVDGSAQPDTLLTLSHWPNSPTPPSLRDDLSAQIAFHYLEHPELHVAAEVVSNNHFDQDGLMSVHALVEPDAAQARRAQVVDVARAGDFGTFDDRDSVRVAWTIAGIEAGLDGADPYVELLARLPELLDHPERFGEHWAEEDAHLRASESAIESGIVRIEEDEALDLAVVTVPEDWSTHPVHRFTVLGAQALHPSAINNATDRFRVLYVHGQHCELQYRYESWVRYVSRRPPARVDLGPLADELSSLEPAGARWTFDGVAAIAPALQPVGGPGTPSAIPPERFRALVVDALARGEPAWDPYV
jgi:Family of unknown function (DUF6687)